MTNVTRHEYMLVRAWWFPLIKVNRLRIVERDADGKITATRSTSLTVLAESRPTLDDLPNTTRCEFTLVRAWWFPLIKVNRLRMVTRRDDGWIVSVRRLTEFETTMYEHGDELNYYKHNGWVS